MPLLLSPEFPASRIATRELFFLAAFPFSLGFETLSFPGPSDNPWRKAAVGREKSLLLSGVRPHRGVESESLRDCFGVDASADRVSHSESSPRESVMGVDPRALFCMSSLFLSIIAPQLREQRSRRFGQGGRKESLKRRQRGSYV